MNLFHVIVLSIVEGVTEFLPISSTGHLILASKLLGLADTDFLKTFEIVIQLGAILAVLVLYYKRLLIDLELLKKVIVGFIPTGVIGLLLYKIIKSYFLGNSFIVVISLVLGGIALILIENWFKRSTHERHTLKQLTYKKAVVIGLIQSVSVIPGVSRAAATIFGGMLTGLTREDAVEFSFLLAIPTMAAATGLDLVKSLHSISSSNLVFLALGTLFSFLVALVVVRWFIHYITKHNFIPFGFYRIIAGIIFFLLFLR